MSGSKAAASPGSAETVKLLLDAHANINGGKYGLFLAKIHARDAYGIKIPLQARTDLLYSFSILAPVPSSKCLRQTCHGLDIWTRVYDAREMCGNSQLLAADLRCLKSEVDGARSSTKLLFIF